ncbi:DNA-directed RNA polymerase II subunit RPB1-like [Phlebotomus papatasi]|uniref:DNA-directed RNA polymerase II subunit RPB1-like n=1 Tax=Phlebotomus papatasi TaxID=29031 RepID=UPI0024833757|nr:DNA-directed RNA polymerase II subunit RPB1-like [Phlebotomus papatasi]
MTSGNYLLWISGLCVLCCAWGYPLSDADYDLSSQIETEYGDLARDDVEVTREKKSYSTPTTVCVEINPQTPYERSYMMCKDKRNYHAEPHRGHYHSYLGAPQHFRAGSGPQRPKGYLSPHNMKGDRDDHRQNAPHALPVQPLHLQDNSQGNFNKHPNRFRTFDDSSEAQNNFQVGSYHRFGDDYENGHQDHYEGGSYSDGIYLHHYHVPNKHPYGAGYGGGDHYEEENYHHSGPTYYDNGNDFGHGHSGHGHSYDGYSHDNYVGPKYTYVHVRPGNGAEGHSHYNAPAPVDHYSGPAHYSSAPVHQSSGPVHHSPVPVHQPSGPVHHSTVPVHHSPVPAYHSSGPVYHTPAPVHYASPPVYYPPAPVYYPPAPVYHTPAPVYHVPETHQSPAPVYYEPYPAPAAPYYGSCGHGCGGGSGYSYGSSAHSCGHNYLLSCTPNVSPVGCNQHKSSDTITAPNPNSSDKDDDRNNKSPGSSVVVQPAHLSGDHPSTTTPSAPVVGAPQNDNNTPSDKDQQKPPTANKKQETMAKLIDMMNNSSPQGNKNQNSRSAESAQNFRATYVAKSPNN